MWVMLRARRSASLRRGASSDLEKSTLSQTSIFAGRAWRQPSKSGWSEITVIGSGAMGYKKGWAQATYNPDPNQAPCVLRRVCVCGCIGRA